MILSMRYMYTKGKGLKMKLTKWETVIESILFALAEPVSAIKIANILDEDEESVESIIIKLKEKYETENRGFQIVEIDKHYQMATNPKYFKYIEAFLKTSKKKQLTQTLLETLAIIAYKQPITKSQVQEIRGVNSDNQINKLIGLNLVVEKGRLNTAGKPIIFGTSKEFLRYFGFSSLDSLPKLNEDIEKLKEEIEQEIYD